MTTETDLTTTGAPSRDGRTVRPAGPHAVPLLAGLLSGRLLPTDAFTGVAQRHDRLAHVRMFNEHVYVLTHPEVVRHVLVTNGRSTMKGRGVQQTKQLLGEGLLTSEGALHHRQRRLVQPAFHHERIALYGEQMVAAATEHSDRWSDRERVDLAEQMAALTLDVVGRTLFGADLTAQTREVADALTQVMDGFRRRVARAPGSALNRLPTKGNRRVADGLARLDAVVADLVASHRGAAARRPAGAVGDDVLSMLVAARDDEAGGAGMSDRQVRDEVMTLVLAGHETTANALTWAWFLLGSDPATRARLHAEVDSVPGPLRSGDLARLPWTRAVVAETLRLYPPAWMIGRRLTGDVTVDDWTLPAGSLTIASQWVLHRDPRWWGDAAAFRPARWLDSAGGFDESAPGQPRGAWFPFGLGSRVCIGESFAWTEAVLVLATLARRWDPTILASADPVVAPAVTLRARDGMPALLRARAPSAHGRPGPSV
jgi:cytochrome P450